MKRKVIFFAAGMLISAFLAGCGGDEQAAETESTQETQAEEDILLSEDAGEESTLLSEEISKEESTMSADTQIEQNQTFLMEQVGTPENGTLGTAQLLSEVGCGTILKIDNLEDTGKAYIVTVTDDAGQQFLFTMGYDGYPGYIKDGQGNFLYMPVD